MARSVLIGLETSMPSGVRRTSASEKSPGRISAVIPNVGSAKAGREMAQNTRERRVRFKLVLQQLPMRILIAFGSLVKRKRRIGPGKSLGGVGELDIHQAGKLERRIRDAGSWDMGIRERGAW